MSSRLTVRLSLSALLLAAGVLVWVVMQQAGGSPADDATMPEQLAGLPQGHVYTGLAGEPGDVNPFTTHDMSARSQILSRTHDTLLDRDPATGVLRGALAERYDVAGDGLSCTFRLRDDVAFSDGSPLTMADVMFGWQLADAGHLAMGFVRSAFDRVASAEVVDDRTLRITLRERAFDGVATVGCNWIVSNRSWFEQRMRMSLAEGESLPAIDSERYAELIDEIDNRCGPGTGPYVLHNDPGGRCEWLPRSRIDLVRHEGSWHRSARPGSWNFARLRLLFADREGGFDALLRGDVDWFYTPDVDRLMAAHPKLADDYRKLSYDYPALGAYRIVWNTDHAPFDDPRVRRALGMLLPRDQFVQVFAGAARPAVAHAKRGTTAYPEVKPTPFDPAAAKQLLRECGYDAADGRRLEVTLLTLGGMPQMQRMLDLITDAFRGAGVALDVHKRDQQQFVAEKGQRQWHGLFALQYFDNSQDPYRFLHSQGADNEGRYANARVDALLEQARREPDRERRFSLWRQVHTVAHEDQPVALLVHPLVSILFNRHVQACDPGAMGLSPARGWVAPEHQRR